MADRYDVVIIGGGILGLATARALMERAPDVQLDLAARRREHKTRSFLGKLLGK